MTFEPTSGHLTLITGASRGLGAAMAAQCLQPGDTVVGVSRGSQPRLAELATQQGAVWIEWLYDLAAPADAAAQMAGWLAAPASQSFASMTLINNAAALVPPGPLQNQAVAELARAVRVGLEATLVLTAVFLDATRDATVPRRVLNISSGLGRRAMAGSAAYCAVKAGMDHFTRALALEQAALPNGARVVSLAPGVIDTDMQVQLRSADPAGFPDHGRFVQLQAQGQLDSPAQAAAKVLEWLSRPDFGADAVADVRG